MKQPKINQPSRAPTRKVKAATVGGAAGNAVGNIAVVLAGRIWPGALEGFEAEVHLLVSLTFTAAGTFVAGYVVRDRAP